MEIEKDIKKDSDLFGDEDIVDVIPDGIDGQLSETDADPAKIGFLRMVQTKDGLKPVISFKSLCDKTKSIFQQVKGQEIVVRFSKGENYIYEGDNQCIINLSDPPIKGINKYTAFNHELAHYGFESMNMTFNDYMDDELNEIPEEHRDKALEIYRSVFNVMEDQRVESLMGEIYRGTGMRFRHMRKRLGLLKPKNHKAKNPIEALHCAREYREDAIPKKYSKSKDVIDEVELKDKEATVILSKKYIKDVVNPWIRSQLKNLPPVMNSPNGTKSTDKNKEGNLGQQGGQASSQQGDQSDQPSSSDKIKQDLQEAFNKAYEENRLCDHRELREDTNKIKEELIKQSSQCKSKEELQKIMQELEKNADEKVKEIVRQIEENTRKAKVSFCPHANNIIQVDRNNPENRPNPNMQFARKFNKILKLLQSKNKPHLSTDGDQISIRAVIQRKARGYGDYKIRVKPRSKLGIVVSIDASGSMSGYEIETARDMMATMYKAIKGIDGIELRGIVWGGGGVKDVGISDIGSYKETNRIHCESGYGSTPTPYAVEYSERVLENMKARRKLLIVITDGTPNYFDDGSLDSIGMVRREINRARKKGFGTLGIFTGGGSNENMEKMFGKQGYVELDSMEYAKDIVINNFRKAILREMGVRVAK